MPKFNMTIDTSELDEHGFLLDLGSWNAEKAQAIADRLGLPKLTERHFAVLRCLQEHYQEHRAIRPTVLVCHELGLADDCVEELFGGPLNAWQAAGLPNPGEEARIYMVNQTSTDDDTR